MEYLTHDGRYWACDIEANDLRDEATVIHCVCVEKLQDGERLSFFQKEDFKTWLEAEDRILIGHNFLAYDAPVLNRLWQAKVKVSQIIDTFLFSQVYAPNLAGGHSLDAWGQRLGDHKIAFSDFSHYTPEMLLYCQQDVSLTKKVYLALTKRLKGEGFTERGIELEHLAWNIIQNKQKRNGFPFNQEKADLLYAELRTREEQLKKEIYRLWPPVLECVRTFARGFKSDGTRTKGYLGHLGQYPKLEDNPDGSYNAYDYVEFDLGSPKQRIQKLLDLGWEPVNFTEKGNPKVDEDEMVAFAESSGIKEAKALAEWVVTNARANMIRNWQQAVKQETGHIHGSLFLASTLRYKHSKPNTANIPGNEAQYGEACRNLWDCGDEKEWSLVGIDAKGIQLRILAHYLDVPSFTEAILSEDPHTANQRAMELPTRSLTKTITYACVPMHTRALTKRGWLSYDEIVEGDLVMSYNMEKGVKEWTPILNKIKYDKAPVVRMGHKNTFKVESTPSHRWVVQNRRKKGEAGLKNSERPFWFTTTEEMTSERNILTNAPTLDETPDSGFDFISSVKYGTDWVQAVLDMSQRERQTFLAGFCIADGFQQGTKWGWSQLRGPLYEAALTASYLVNDGFLYTHTRALSNGNSIGTVLLNPRPHVTSTFFEYEELEEQPVWCLETENGTWVMRQGDCITITGNSIMGSGVALMAKTAGVPLSEARRYKDMFFKGLGLDQLISRLQDDLKIEGRITLCTGNKLLVPSDHMVIPYLLQGDESQIMKLAMVMIDREVRRSGYSRDILQVGMIHDELQFQVRAGLEEAFVALALPCFEEVGRELKFNLPIEGDAKIGKAWNETH